MKRARAASRIAFRVADACSSRRGDRYLRRGLTVDFITLQYHPIGYSVAIANYSQRNMEEISVVIVQIEHPVANFTMWKAAFDSDPIDRKASGVRRYRILRPIDDPNYVAVDLEFDDRRQAEAFRGALENLWRTPQAIGAR